MTAVGWYSVHPLVSIGHVVTGPSAASLPVEPLLSSPASSPASTGGGEETCPSSEGALLSTGPVSGGVAGTVPTSGGVAAASEEPPALSLLPGLDGRGLVSLLQAAAWAAAPTAKIHDARRKTRRLGFMMSGGRIADATRDPGPREVRDGCPPTAQRQKLG